MKSKLIVNEAMLLLERNMQVGWHFTRFANLLQILKSGDLQLSLSRYEGKDLSRGRKYYLSTSRTKDFEANSYTKLWLGSKVRFEIDLRRFKTIPANHDWYTNRPWGRSQYEERIISDTIDSIDIASRDIRAIDLFIDNPMSGIYKPEHYDNLVELIYNANVFDKVLFYDNRTDFINQKNGKNVIDHYDIVKYIKDKEQINHYEDKYGWLQDKINI